MGRKVPMGRKNGNESNATNIALVTAILTMLAELVRLLDELLS